ncbi:DUF4926 domain-containing protein [Pantoea agglomerans]|uniref:DUF4926 domain-containing protein n=1 Tax=Enterobacter agglomerans TaxID=549 RepID=UPI003C7330C3
MLSDFVAVGCKETVVMIHTEPILGYEVDFIDDIEVTLDVLTLYTDDIQLLRLLRYTEPPNKALTITVVKR